MSDSLIAALTGLHARLDRLRFPLQLAGAAEARVAARRLGDQIDDYLIPRLRRLDAPLLAVVGGSTGAGKSTLVNSLVAAQVTDTGVLRPTTRTPVLVHHPDDAEWFHQRQVLPGLQRGRSGSLAASQAGHLTLVATAALPPGLALLDAPDIDSVVLANHTLAAELLAAADLWLFVTTAARYADAVPWEFLREAASRSAEVAVVLDRVPPSAAEPVTEHLAGMLAAEGLGRVPLFLVAETEVFDGRLPGSQVAALRLWLHGLAADSVARAGVARRTLDGVLSQLPARVSELAAAAHRQAEAVDRLRQAVELAYAEALQQVEQATRDGAPLRGEVLARWQEVAGSGELLRALQSRLGRARDRVAAALRGRPEPVQALHLALETGVEAVLLAAAERAAQRTAHDWLVLPGGAALGVDPVPEGSSAELRGAVHALVQDWHQQVVELVRTQARGRRSAARVLSYGVNGAALFVMLAVFVHTSGLTGGEVVVAGGASAVSQKLLEALLGDQAVRTLAAEARGRFLGAAERLLAGERERYDTILAPLLGTTAGELLASVAELEAAR